MRLRAKQMTWMCNSEIADWLRREGQFLLDCDSQSCSFFVVVLPSAALLLDVACVVEGWVAEFAPQGFDGLGVLLHMVLGRGS